MSEKYVRFLSETFLFSNIPFEECARLLKDIPIDERSYNKGDTIFTPCDFERKIGFITEGECWVSRYTTSNHNVPLNVIKRGDSFGITSVFSAHDVFPTIISAKTFCSVFFIDSSFLVKIIGENSQVALNVIRFLTERIEFLNSRIAAFSESSVESKLISHILSLQKQSGSTEFPFNKKFSAEAISCGRASLYRAMESLEAKGFIKFDSKKIYITDLNGLERMKK